MINSLSSTHKRPGSSPDELQQTWVLLSNQVEAFIQAWEAGGTPPPLPDYLPAGPPALRMLSLVELIKVDLEYRWFRPNVRRFVEDYLGEFPELAAQVPADLIYEEYHIRKQAGDAVDPQDYFRRFPARAAELERLLGLQAPHASTSMFGSATAKPAPVFEAGQQIDDFDLLLKLGQGAFASVFLARQRSMQRMVALKVSADRGTEPQTLAQFDHDNIVRVYDQRQLSEQGLRLMYMQYVPGGTLLSVVEAARMIPLTERTGGTLFEAIDLILESHGESIPAGSPLREKLKSLSWPEVVCWVGARLAYALDYAHRQGVLHRDIKPANVLISAEGTPKLADFNISFCSKVAGVTPAAYFGGSLAYMSPEQLEACNPACDRQPDCLDGRSDLYSLGVLLWELLAAERPFPDEELQPGWGSTLANMVSRRQAGPNQRAFADRARHWPAGLLRVLLTCLQSEPGERYQTGGELARQLELCLQPRAQSLLHPSQRPWRKLARRFPMTLVIAGAVLPNVVAAVFNYVYNLREIVAHLQGAQETFWNVQAVINAITFPIGTAAIVYLSYPVTSAVRRSTRDLPDDELRWLRARSVRIGHYSAMVSLTLWSLAGIAYPVAVSQTIVSVRPEMFVHFLGSLVICGLIAAAYPFFCVSALAVRQFYPKLIRLESLSRDDRRDLDWVARRAWVYLAIAVSVPMLAVAILLLMESRSQILMGILAGGSVFGFLGTFVLFRQLQEDVGTLEQAMSPGDIHDSGSQLFGRM